MSDLNGGEITLLVLLIANLVLNAYLHGSEKDGKHDFWVALVSVIISFLLYKWAGLF